MEKNYEESQEKARYIEENLRKRYPEIFEKYQMSDVQVCNLAEFLIKQNPEKYENDRAIYETDENLKRIYTVIYKDIKARTTQAVMINTSKDGKLPEGEIGVYDIQKDNFKVVNEDVKKKLKESLIRNVNIYAKDVYDPQKDMEKMNEMLTLDDIQRIATMGDREIDNIAKRIVTKDMTREKNRENGKSDEEQDKLEEKSQRKSKENLTREDEKEETSKLPPHIAKYCIMAGIVAPKAVIDTKAVEAANKIDEPTINRNGGNVTIIKVKDESKETDKYLVFQDGKMVIPGTRDDKIDKIVGRRMQNSKDGSMIKPLEIDDKEQYFEYTDSQGLDIKEKLEEGVDLSVNDLENYKREVKQELEKYSSEIYKISEEPFLSDVQKDELYGQANERFNNNNMELAKKYNIKYDDMKEINISTDKRTQEQQDMEQEDEEPDPDEVRHRNWYMNQRKK